MSDFEKAFRYTMINEGSWANHKSDRGGPTAYGITIATLGTWRKAPVTEQDVKTLTEAEAKQIYEKNYWRAMRCDKIVSQSVATAIFDYGVNAGPKTAVRLAQMALNEELRADGVMGPKTLEKLNAVDPVKFLSDYHDLVSSRYFEIVENDATQKVFLKGWLRRADRLLTLA